MDEKPSKAASERDRLIAELGDVRRLGIVRVESRKHKQREFLLLRKHATLLAGPDQSFVTALEALIRAAIDRLPAGLLKRTASTIYGFHANISDAVPGQWRKNALRLHAPMGMEVFRKTVEPQTLNLIAAEIQALLLEHDAEAALGPVLGTTYDLGAAQTVLDSDQAVDLVSDLLPAATRTDCVRLAMALGHQRRVIEQTCAYLAGTPGLGIEDFCYMLAREPELTLAATADKPERALTFLYRCIISELADQAPRSLELLELLVFLPHVFVPVEYAMSYLLQQPYIPRHDLPLGVLTLAQAVRPLQSHGLVEVDEYQLSINPLTQDVLRTLFQDRLEQVVRRAQSLGAPENLAQLTAEGWGAFSTAGRIVADLALRIRHDDRTRNQDTLHRQGMMSGPAWHNLITRRLFVRMQQQLIMSILQLASGQLEDTYARMQADSIPASATPIELGPFPAEGLHPLQLAEVRDMQEVRERLEDHIEAQGDVALRRLDGSDFNKGLAQLIAQYVAYQTQRYIDTGIGELDHASIDSEWNDISVGDAVTFLCDGMIEEAKKMQGNIDTS